MFRLGADLKVYLHRESGLNDIISLPTLVLSVACIFATAMT